MESFTYEEAYYNLFGEVNYNQDGMNFIAQDLISRLLIFDPIYRLGSGESENTSAKAVLRHAFFDGIDWDKIANKECIPPFIPEADSPFSKLFPPEHILPNGSIGANSHLQAPPGVYVAPHARRTYTFEEMIKVCGKESWLPHLGSNRENNANISAPSPAARSKTASMYEIITGSNKPIAPTVPTNPAELRAAMGNGNGNRPSKYILSPPQEAYFKDWSYVSPTCILAESSANASPSNSARNVNNNQENSSTVKEHSTWVAKVMRLSF